MTPEEFAKMKRLCELIAKEQDEMKLIELAETLNALLDRVELQRPASNNGK